MRPSGYPIKALLVDGKLFGGMVASWAANFAVAGEETCTPKRMDIRYLINLKPAIGYQFNGYGRKCQLLKGIFPVAPSLPDGWGSQNILSKSTQPN